MHPTAAVAAEQDPSVALDTLAVFNLLAEPRFATAVADSLPPHRHRRYPPLETLAMFVRQALAHGGACQQAVDEHIALCIARGTAVPSASTAAYCEARARLPQTLVERLARELGRQVCSGAERSWRWHGRRVLLVDGTGFSMPDTAANEQRFPRADSARCAVGFPQGRLCVLSCASTGAIVDARISAAKGKASGEQTQLRALGEGLVEGDVLVGDAINENYWTFVMLDACAADGVFELGGSRYLPSKACSVMTIRRPRRPEWMDKERYAAAPAELVVRVTVSKKRGFPDRTLLSTFSDERAVGDAEIVALYARRWSVEGDFRALKCALDGGILRCRTPAMVEKELWVHLLAYNLVRLVMSEAARAGGCEPRQLGFTHALTSWRAWLGTGQAIDARGLEQMLQRIAARRVGNRAGRCEPRAIKRRPKPRSRLDMPRALARKYWYTYER